MMERHTLRNDIARPQDGVSATFVPIPQGTVSKKHYPNLATWLRCPSIDVISFMIVSSDSFGSVRDHQTHQSSWGTPVEQTRLENKSSVSSTNNIFNRFVGIPGVRYGSTARGSKLTGSWILYSSGPVCIVCKTKLRTPATLFICVLSESGNRSPGCPSRVHMDPRDIPCRVTAGYMDIEILIFNDLPPAVPEFPVSTVPPLNYFDEIMHDPITRRITSPW